VVGAAAGVAGAGRLSAAEGAAVGATSRAAGRALFCTSVRINAVGITSFTSEMVLLATFVASARLAGLVAVLHRKMRRERSERADEHGSDGLHRHSCSMSAILLHYPSFFAGFCKFSVKVGNWAPEARSATRGKEGQYTDDLQART
jgi:hypothetical protein